MIKKFMKKRSLVPKGLRYKLMIAFSLMSVIPLLICMYLVSTFIFPNVETMGQVSIIVLFTISIAFLGLVLAKRLVDPVVDMAIEAKIIAGGEYDHTIKTDKEDEIGELGKSINTITKEIKEYMSELHSYSVRTKDINLEIQKKILALSNLLQIGDMIAASEDIESILNLVVDKTAEISKDGLAALYLLREDHEDTDELELYAFHGNGKNDLKSMRFRLGRGYVGRAIGAKIGITIDASTKMTKELESVKQDFQVENCLIMPVVVRRKVMGFLFTGNNEEKFRFLKDDLELTKVLAKQIGIAIENDLLTRKAEQLAFKDDLTGLYNESFIKSRLDEEIHRAILCQRPCSFLLFNIDNFTKYRDAHGEMATEELLKMVARILKENATELGKVSRLGGDEFAIVLPEKNKKEAYDTAEDIRKKVQKFAEKSKEKNQGLLTVSAGVSENPIDGATAEDLLKKAVDALKTAKKEGKNRVIA